MLEQSLFPKEPSLPYPPNTKKPRETKRKMWDSKCIMSEWLSLMKIVWGILVAFIVWTPKQNPKFTRIGNKFETWSNSRGIPSTDKGLRSRKVVLQNKYTRQHAKHAQARMMNLKWKTCGICPEQRKSKRRHKTLEVWMGSPYPKDHKPALQGVRS